MVFPNTDFTGFSRIRRINDENEIYSAEINDLLLHRVNIHPVIYVLVTNKYATYYEMRTKYTIWEVLDRYEIAMVNLYNRYVITENKPSR